MSRSSGLDDYAAIRQRMDAIIRDKQNSLTLASLRSVLDDLFVSSEIKVETRLVDDEALRASNWIAFRSFDRFTNWLHRHKQGINSFTVGPREQKILVQNLLLNRAPSEQPTPPKRIVLIEDNDLTAKLVRDVCEAHGYQIYLSRCGASGYELVCEKHPDIVIVDEFLPDATGCQIVARIRGNDRFEGIPIIGWHSCIETHFFEADCDACIWKPLRVLPFLWCLESLL